MKSKSLIVKITSFGTLVESAAAMKLRVIHTAASAATMFVAMLFCTVELLLASLEFNFETSHQLDHHARDNAMKKRIIFELNLRPLRKRQYETSGSLTMFQD